MLTASTQLAKCFALAIKILSHDDGKQALVDLGRAMVMGWAEENRHVFGGNIDEMPKYVDHFLERIVDFPVVTLSYLMPREVYAMTDRMDLWMMKASGKCQLTDYHPKDAAYLTYNYRVSMREPVHLSFIIPFTANMVRRKSWI